MASPNTVIFLFVFVPAETGLTPVTPRPHSNSKFVCKIDEQEREPIEPYNIALN